MNASPANQTTYLGLSRRGAAWVLAVSCLVVALSVFVSSSRLGKGFADKPSRGPGDVELYQAEVQRIERGESYYHAAGEELRQRGYPTHSVFNWRTPLPMWLIGVLPSPEMAKVLLGLLALAAVAASFELLSREGGKLSAVVGMLWLCGAAPPCLLGDLMVMPVLWAGMLILLSVALLGLGWTRSGVAAGIGAVFFRDLAGPYCVLSLGLALWRRRYREAAGWFAGLAFYGVFFAWHVAQVAAEQQFGGVVQHKSWVQFGGLAFVISATQMNGWLLVLPQWVAAVYLSLALLGFAGWSGSAGERIGLTAAGYMLLFGFVGQDFNQYWGSLLAPLLCLGAAWAPNSVRDLWRVAVAQSSRSDSRNVLGSASSAA